MRKIINYTVFLVLSIVFALSTNTSLVNAQIISQNCDPELTVKKAGGSSSTTDLIIKPVDATKVVIDVKFTGGFGTSTQSNCPGQGAWIGSWDKTNKYTIPLNRNGSYQAPVPKTEGVYDIELLLSDPPDFTPNHIYIVKKVIVRVAKDILNPPTGNGNNNTGNGNGTGTGNSNTNTVDPGVSNPNINTDVGVNFNVNLDENLGTFFNPLEAESIPELIATIIRILFVLAGITAVIVIIIAGFRMVIDSGNETQVKKAKEAITWAVIGLIVSILAFSIVAIIQRIIQS